MRDRQLRARTAQLVATVAAAVILVLIARNEIASLRSDERRPEEFMAFYTVGHMLNRSSTHLYDSTAFLAEYDGLFPRVSGGDPLYGHAPFEALVFRPFARLPFESAVVAWQAVSLALVGAGFSLVWLSGEALPRSLLPLALLLAISFHPTSVSLILNGQVSGLVFLWIALAIWLQRRGREYGSGAVLALCLSKPTLLILLLPMLVVARRWRVLVGFLGGTVAVGALSLAVVGGSGCIDYVLTLFRFGKVATAGDGTFSPPSLYVDLNSFIRMLTAWPGAWPLLLLIPLAAGIVPWLIRVWRNVPPGWTTRWQLTLAGTITWTMLLNVYVPRYDTPIIMLGILPMVDALLSTGHGRLPLAAQALFGLLYVVPWIPVVPLGHAAILQPYTIILAALGAYQLWWASKLRPPGIPG